MRLPHIAVPLCTALFLALPGFCQETYHITLPQPRTDGWFGTAVALDGDLALITQVDNHRRGAGFLVDLTTSDIVRKYDPSSGDASATFGAHAALTGPHLVISATQETRNFNFSGAVHLYDRDTGAVRAIFYGEQAWQFFGVSLDAYDDQLLIGASGDGALGSFAGATYVADLAAGTLGLKLFASDGAADFRFGNDVALGPNMAAIGAPRADGGRGAVYVFDTASWTELVKLAPMDLGPDDRFGASVALDADRLIVGATAADTLQGAVYVYELSTGALLRRIPSPTGQTGQFGIELDLFGNLAIISGGSGPWLVDIETGQVIRHLESCAGPIGSRPVAIGVSGMLGALFTETVDGFKNSGGAYIWTDFDGMNLGTSFCGPANLNSTGGSARLGARGCPQVAPNLFDLRASKLPALVPGYPLVSRNSGFVPFAGGSQGNLCLGGSIGRATSLLQMSSASGEAVFPIDLLAIPQGTTAVTVMPGETWRFQIWFRNANPQPTSNFTEGLAMTFE